MDVENNFESTFREDSSYNSFIESLENIYISSSSSVELSIPQYTLIENTTTISVGNLKTCSLSELDESTEEASIYEIMKKIKQIGEDKLINNSYKKRLGMQINIMKYHEGEVVGYVFKFLELKKKNESKITLNDYIPKGNKEIIFDLLTLSYIRTVLVTEKTGKKKEL